MDKLWKWVMHLNAKAFCLTATLLFLATALWCGFKYMTPPVPFKDGGSAVKHERTTALEIGILGLVSNQLAAETLTIPVDPFRPTLEAIFTNETERTAFLKALRAAQNAAAGVAGTAAGAKKEDPFAHLRKKEAAPGELTGPDGRPMVIPKLSFLGFFQRPDGTQAAMFHDSVENSTVFYDTGKQIHGVDIVNADVRQAEIRFPDGTTRKLEIGGSVELSAEPAKTPPPKKVVPQKPAAAAAAAKPGAAKAAPPQKPGLQNAAKQQAAAKQAAARQAAAKQAKQAARQPREQAP